MAEKPRLKQQYETEIVPKLTERFEYKNINEVPKLVKVSVNMGISDAKSGPEAGQILETAMKELALISGQRPSVTRARKSIANFQVRAGSPVGCRVTLRGARAWEFVDRLFNIALPRIRDFRGVPRNSFDGRGNYSLGIKEQLVFAELNYDDVKVQRGMDITIVTTAKSDEEAREFLVALGLPLAHEG